jgi:hypothetical protein
VKKNDDKKTIENPQLLNKDLKDQVKYLLELPDDQYNDKKITQDLRKFIMETDKHHTSTVADYKTHIAPSYWKAE